MLVVYRHVFEGIKESGIDVRNYMGLEYANIFFYSFRMPLFFIISGVFVASSLNKRGLKKYIDTRARAILYPYFVWGFLQLTIQMIFTKYTNGHPTPWSYFDLLYQPREIAQFWYLYALFNVSVIYAFSKQVLKLTAIQNLAIGLILFYFSTIVFQKNLKVEFLNDIFHNYIFFAIGDFISFQLLRKENYRFFESGKTVLVLLCPFIAAQAYFLWANVNNTTDKYMYVEYFQPFVFLLIAVIGCAFVVSFTFYLQKKNRFQWLTYLGRHSLYIYVSHVMAFATVRVVLNQFLGIENVFVILISGIFAAITVPLFLYNFAVKNHFRWIFTLEKTEEKGKVKLPQQMAVPSINNKV